MGSVRDDKDSLAEKVNEMVDDVGFTGVVRIDLDSRVAFQAAYGKAHRALGIPSTIDTQFGTASAAKGFTAMTVMSMVERGELTLDSTARSILGDDLPLIDDRVTVRHLLTHRSGIGDYFDEDEFHDPLAYVLKVPAHDLATTEQYLSVLAGYPMKSDPGEQFAYNNGGYVVLALIAERVAGVPYHDLVDQRVCTPAGMADTAFLRSDELPGRAALGYLEDDGLRTNIFHLPVRGSGDGGIYTTAADIHTFWDAFLAGRIVSPDTVAQMLRPSGDTPPEESMRYGLGFWLYESTDTVSLHGFDAGVGFVTVRDPGGRFTYTVLCNKGRGAWPVSQRLDALLGIG